MSVQYTNGQCHLLSHESKINHVYARNGLPGRRSFEIDPNLFKISSKYLRENQSDSQIPSNKREKINRKKRQIQIEQNPELYELIDLISRQHESFIGKCQQMDLLHGVSDTKNNAEALSLAKQIKPDTSRVLSGQNLTDHPVTTEIGSVSFLIPPTCKFFQNDVAQMSALINDRFHFVSIDPPWWNKYIRRAKHAQSESGYKMMDSDDILSIPLENYTHADSLVAIWCTNSPSHISLIRKRLLDKWNLRLVSTWYWVKITTSGQTVCDFGIPLQKQPFEHLFVACHKDSDISKFAGLVQSRFLFSVPSAIHSHKPPIIDLFEAYLPKQPQCLEVFARYLIPGFTSIGFEVLQLQNMRLFRERMHE